jgi:hypothetical protein
MTSLGSTGMAFVAENASALSNMLGRDSAVALQLRSYAGPQKNQGRC